MTFNDLEVNERCLKIRRMAMELPKLQRDDMEGSLFLYLMLIQEEAEKAQERLNRLKWAPQREPMGA